MGLQQSKKKLDDTIVDANKVVDTAQEAVEKAEHLIDELEDGGAVENVNEITENVNDITDAVKETKIVENSNELVLALKEVALEVAEIAKDFAKKQDEFNQITSKAGDKTVYWTVILTGVCSAFCFFPLFLCLLFLALDISNTYGFDHRFILFFSYWGTGIFTIAALTYWHVNNNMEDDKEKKIVECYGRKQSLTRVTGGFVIGVWMLMFFMTWVINRNYPDRES